MAFVSYDSYKNRIEKLAKFKNFVVRFKFLIIGVLAVIIGGISALLATKGMITADMTLSGDTFTYGQSYSPAGATAFLSDVNYEYALQGSDEWTDKKPVKVGKYSVRAVTDKVIGNGYGKTVNFEILPAEITFAFNNNGEATLVYGSDPAKSDYSFTGLVPAYGDSVKGAVFSYDYPEAVGEDVGVTLTKLDIRAGEEDRSDCYVYNTPSTTYKFAAKPVSFKLENASETYNGKAFDIVGKPDAYTQSQLVGGDNYAFATKITDGSGAAVTPVNAGGYFIALDGDLKVTDGGKDVTYRYDISTPVSGAFTVNKRPVTLLSETDEWTYDGLTHSNDKYRITSGSLADGQRITATSLVSVTDVSDGMRDNALNYEISDSTGTPVTENYALTQNTGTVRVKPRPLTVTTKGGEWEYDGNSYTNEDYTVTGLANGQSVANVTLTRVTNVSDSYAHNNIIYFDILSGGVTVDKNNYSITTDYGTLTITPRPLKVVTDGAERAYNGTALTVGTYTVTYGGNKTGQTNAFINYGEDLSIVGSLPKITNVGTKENAIKFSVPNNNYYIDETKTQNGVLKITPAEITVTLSNASCDYGDTLPAPAYTVQGVPVDYNGKLFGVDTFTPAFLYDGGQARLLNTGSYTISLDKAKCNFTYGNREPVTEPNYEITDSTTGTLTVGSRTVTVKLNDTSATYGNQIKYGGGYATVSGLVDGQTLNVDADKVTFAGVATMPDADTYENVISCPVTAISILSGGATVTANYAVTVEPATLTVNQREITVKAKDMPGIIYGEAIEYKVEEGNYANEPELVAGEKLTVENVIYNFNQGVTPTVGDYAVTPDVNRIKILKADGVTSSRSNYKITPADGRLEIVKRPVRIQSATNVGFIYNGTAQFDKGFTVLLDNPNYYDVLSEHNIEVTEYKTVTDVSEGTVKNVLTYAIKDQSGSAVTGNYDITPVEGTLKVNPLAIKIKPLDYSATYGDSYAYRTGAGNFEIVEGALAAGETLEITSVIYGFGANPLPDASAMPYAVTLGGYKILKANGANSKDNYTVTSENGALTILKRDITVQLLTYSATYGDSYAYKTGAGNYANTPDLVSGETLEITAVTYEFGTAKYPDVRETAYTVTLDGYKILKANGDSSYNNYTVTPVDGALTILKRAATVALNDIVSLPYGEEVAYAGGYKNVTGVLPGHTVAVNATTANMSFSPAATYPNAGKYTFTCESSLISIDNGTDDVSGNYSVTVTAGNLEITKREITVTLNPVENVIYGEALPKPELTTAGYGDLEEGLVNGDEAQAASYVYRTADGNTVGRYNVGSYKVYLGGITFTYANGAPSTTKNYEIQGIIAPAEFEITKRPIIVTLHDIEREYGVLSSNEHLYWFNGLLENTYCVAGDFGQYIEMGGEYGLASDDKLNSIDWYVLNKDTGERTRYEDVKEYTLRLRAIDVTRPDGSSDRIYLQNFDGSGVLNPDNYEWTGMTEATLTITPKDLTVTLGDITATYGDKIVYKGGETATGLLKNHMLAVDTANFAGWTFSPTDPSKGYTYPDAGNYNFTCPDTEIIVYLPNDGGGDVIKEVTANYVITVIAGNLTINKRPVTVTLNDMPDFVYGEKVEYTSGGETADNLVSGHYVSIDPETVNFGVGEHPNVGEYNISANENLIKIYYDNESGEAVDVTSNYDISAENGTLTVNARKITITLGNATNVYGEDLGKPEITVSELVYDDTFTPAYLYTLTSAYFMDIIEPTRYNAGEYLISLDMENSSFTYTNGAPSSTENYEIVSVTEDAILTITKRKITVTLKDFSRVYGQNNATNLHWYKGISYLASAFIGDMDMSDLITVEGLASKENVKEIILQVYEAGTENFGNCKEAGAYDIGLYALTISYPDGALQSSENYEYDEPERATLTVDPKDLKVDLGNLTATYGDDPFKDYSLNTTAGLAFNENLTISKIFAEKGSVAVTAQYPDAGSYTLNANASDAVISNKWDTIIENGYKNYNITFTGNLTINKRSVTITLNDMPDVVYDGNKPVYESDNTETAEGLLSGHTFKIISEKIGFTGKNGAVMPNAGDYDITAENGFVSIYSETDGVKEDVTANYKVAFVNGTLTINARKITVTLQPVENVIYGEARPEPDYTTAGYGDLIDGLIGGDEIKVTDYGYKTADGKTVTRYDVGSYNVNFGSFDFVDKDGNTLPAENYEIVGEIAPVGFEITKRPITVTLHDIEREYGVFSLDSTYLVWQEGLSEKNGRVGGDVTQYIDIGGEYNLASGERVHQIVWYVLDKDTGYTTPYQNAKEYTLRLRWIYVENSDGTHDKIYLQSADESYSSSTGNYEVTGVEDVTLTITPKAVEVNIGEIEVTYGEQDFLLNGYEYTYESEEIPFGETIKLPELALEAGSDYRLDKGSYALDSAYNKRLYEVYDEDGARCDVEMQNYDLTVTGELVVNPRTVEVELTAFEGSFIYGDGEKLVYATGAGNYANVPDLAYGQQLEVVIVWTYNGETVAAPKNAGNYTYGMDGANSKIYGEDGGVKENGLSNYSFDCEAITLIINKFGFSVNFGEDNAGIYGDKLENIAGEYYHADFAGDKSDEESEDKEDSKLPYNESIEIAFEYTTNSENPQPTTPKEVGEYLMRYTKYRALNEDKTISEFDNYIMVEDKGGKLTISAREITVNSISLPDVIFGDPVSYTIEQGNHGDIGGKGLPADEYLTITSVDYYDKDGNLLEGTPTEVGTYYIVPTGVEIYDGNGNRIDTDRNYVITYPAVPDELSACGTVTVLPVKLLLVTNSHDEWIYNGDFQYDTGYTLWLLNDENVKVRPFTLPEEEQALVVIGDYIKVKEVCTNVENAVEYDFSQTNYVISSTEYGTLTVHHREVTIESATNLDNWIYDGSEFSDENFEVTSVLGIVDGHDVVVSDPTKLVDVGNAVDNEHTYTIIDTLDGDADVTDNYQITPVRGKIKVNPRPIKLQSATDDTIVYDGEEHFNEGFEQIIEDGALALVDGHGISVTGNTKVRTVMEGEVENELTYKITDNNDGGKDVTGNYQITPVNGKLKVNPKHITVVLNSYLGLTYGETVYPDELNNYDLLSSTALAGDDELKVAVKFYDKTDETKTPVSTVRSVGSYGVVLDLTNCFVQTSYGAANGFGNYIIDNAETAEGEITITPKNITVTLSDLDKVYGEEFDGYPAVNGNFETDDGLAYDDTLQVAVTYPDGEVDERTAVGDFAIAIDYALVNGVRYDVGDTANVIDAGDYVITFIDGTLSVTPRPITIVTGSADRVYTGEYLYSPEASADYKVKVYYKNSFDGVPDGIVAWDNAEDVLQFVASSVKKIINAETIDNDVEYTLLSGNYEFAADGYSYGALTINKRPVKVALQDISNQTYGTPLSYPDGSAGANFAYADDTEYELVDGESIVLAVKFKNAEGEYVEPKAVGVYTYEPDLDNSVLTGSVGGAGVDNYIFTAGDEKSAEVEKLYVKIALEAWATEVYNGGEHAYEGAVQIVEGGKNGKFAYNESFDLAVNYYAVIDGVETLLTGLPVNAGNYAVKYDAANSSIGGYAPDKNYTLEGPEDIYFTVSPKNITISMGAETYTYDGTVYDYLTANKNFKANGAVGGETVVPSVGYYADEALTGTATPKLVDTYYIGYNSFTVEGGNAKAENYNLITDVSGLKCRLDIVKRELTVTVTVGKDSIELGDELPEVGFESVSNGAFGFVTEDLASVTPVYTYYFENEDGSYTEVSADTVNKNIGNYKIEVTFTATDNVLDNYDVTESVEAYLEVTARKVEIVPDSFADVVYSGQPISLGGFTYKHYHKGFEPEAGFAEGDEPAYKLEFTDSKNVSTFDAPVNAGSYTAKFVFEGIDASRYDVENEKTVSFRILPKPVNVTLSGYSEGKLDGLLTYNYSKLPEDLVTASTADIIAGEASTVEWYYDNKKYGDVEYNYAGDYTISARVVDATGKTDNNYTVASIDEITFTVQKSDLYVTPIGEREDYTYEGQTLSLTRYKIWEEYGVLYGSDTLSVEGSGVLKTTRMMPVTIKKVTIMQNGLDVTDCYAVHTKYEEGSPVAEENFRAMLQFNPVKIYYEQAVLDDAHRYFEYTGRPHDLGVDKNNLQNYVTIQNPQNFVGTYRLQYVLATVNAVREYEKWIQILVFDGSGNNVTSLYDLTLLNAAASKIVVHGDDFSITGLTDAEIKTAWDNKDGAGSLLSESQYGNGYYVLDGSAYGSTGLKAGHECEVLVREVDGALETKVIIFTQTASGRVESCMTYSLNPTDGLTVTLSYIGQLRASTTTN